MDGRGILQVEKLTLWQNEGIMNKQVTQRAMITHLRASMPRKAFFQQFRAGCSKQICSRAGNSNVNGEMWPEFEL